MLREARGPLACESDHLTSGLASGSYAASMGSKGVTGSWKELTGDTAVNCRQAATMKRQPTTSQGSSL